MKSLAALVALGLATSLAALEVPPAPSRYVTDYTGRLDPAGLARAEAALAALERTHGHQVVAVFFPSLEGEVLEDFTIRTAEAWRVGRKGLDDGVIFFAFLAERRLRLEVGYGLEGKLPDALARRLLDHTVRPAFARGDLAGGIVALAGAVDRVFSGAPAPVREEKSRPVVGLLLLGVILVVLVVLLAFAGAAGGHPPPRMGRRPSPWGTSMGGFTGGWGGGVGSLGGFGGFSPGGGGFGGGGASGSW